MDERDFSFDPAKNLRLIAERGISFEQIISLIESGKLIRIVAHPNQVHYPNQLLYEVDVDGYIFVVPVVKTGKNLFLKTIYPSRKATRLTQSNHPASRSKGVKE